MKPVCRRILMTFELGEILFLALSLESPAAVVLCHIDALRAKT